MRLSQKTAEQRYKNMNLKLLGAYKGTTTKVPAKCLKCGYIWNSRPSSVFNHEGCPRCGYRRRARENTYSQVQVNKIYAKMHLKPLEKKYKGCHYKVPTKCLKCGYIWKTSLQAVSRGKGCPKCGSRHRVAGIRKQQLLKLHHMLKKMHVVTNSKYVTNQSLLKLKCLKCGNTWTARATEILQGKGCPKCGFEKQVRHESMSDKEFRRELAPIAHGQYTVISKYISRNHKVKVHCNKCGKTWWALPNNLLFGSGCPYCASRYEASNGERIVCHMLKSYGLKESSSRDYHCKDGDFVYGCNNIPWLNGKHLDFWIPKLRLAIEVQGDQHYHPVKMWGGKKQLKNIKKRDKHKVVECGLERVTLTYILTRKYEGVLLKKFVTKQMKKNILPLLRSLSLAHE